MFRSAFAAAVACVLLAGCGGHAQHKSVAAIAASGQSAMGSVHPPGWGTPAAPAGPAINPTATATAEQFDSIVRSTIPIGARYLAGYVDGHWPTAGVFAGLPWRPHVTSIAVFYGDVAQCGDFEPGDMTPGQAPAFWRFQRAHGVTKPCLYSAWWEFTHQIIPAMRAADIPDGAWWKWDADLRSPRRPGVDSGFDCTQWTFTAYARNLDESTCTLAFLGITPQPRPKPRVRWATAQIQLHGLNGTVVAHERNGHWTVGAGQRIRSQPYDSRPLGG